jgi:serine/threonine-protein kinase
MDAALHLAALRICAEVMERAADERERAVDELAAGDVALAALVRDLLSCMTRGAHALPTGGAAGVAHGDRSGTRLGGYQLDRLLGSGGMGAVYLARREDHGVVREVALKTMHRMLPGAAELARFANEQRALASLHHPYVAAFVDVGVADDGTPYYAMEYVPGTIVTRFCDERAWSIAQRVGLFLQICEAVEGAHRKLIVHRDIKPANVLVTDDGHPKLLDFGVAKLLAEEGADDAAPTIELGRMLTLDYASPERILHGALSTGEDVYGLAVLLYELLVGQRPFERGGLDVAALAHALQAEVATSPPLALERMPEARRQAIAEARGTSPQRLRRQLAGDLVSIFARALHPDATRRYGTVDSLAEDVRRWMRGETVRARGDSRGYRLRRFVARHRVAVGTAAATFVLLVAALGVSLYQAEAARREAMRATAVSAFLEQLLAAPNARWDSTWRGGASVQVRDVLALASRHLDQSLAEQPEVRVQLRGSLARAWSALGMHEAAVVEQRKALATIEAAPDAPALQRVRALTTLATMLDYSPLPAHRAEAREHLGVALRLLDAEGGAPRIERAVALGELGNSLHRDGRFAEAVTAFDGAIEAFGEAGGDPDDPLVAVGYGLLGTAHLERHDIARAVVPLDEAVRIYDVHRDRPLTDASLAHGARALIHLAHGENAQVLRRVAEAVHASRQVDAPASADHLLVLTGAAYFECALGRVGTCGTWLASASSQLARMPTADDALRAGVGLVRAEHALRTGNAAQALALLEPLRAMADYTRVRGMAGYDVQGRWLLAMGRALRGTGQRAEGRVVFARGVARQRAVFGAGTHLVRALDGELRGW